MKASDFLSMHNQALEHDGNELALNKIIAGVIRSKVDSVNYLKWVTVHAHSKDNAQSVKAIQNKTNKSTTQRMVFDIDAKTPLTQKVRLVRANKPMVAKGLFTQAELDTTPKPYKFITSEVVVKEYTFAERLQKLVDSYQLTKVQVVKQVDKIDFA